MPKRRKSGTPKSPGNPIREKTASLPEQLRANLLRLDQLL
jgi:hypothetical protein